MYHMTFPTLNSIYASNPHLFTNHSRTRICDRTADCCDFRCDHADHRRIRTHLHCIRNHLRTRIRFRHLLYQQKEVK